MHKTACHDERQLAASNDLDETGDPRLAEPLDPRRVSSDHALLAINALADALGVEVAAASQVSGGDVAEAFRLDLSDGRVVFAKTRAGAPSDFFDTEARGLRWLREAKALPVPAVVQVGSEPPLLVLEWIDEAHRRPHSDADFGRSLAALHATGAPCFGREDRRTTGSRGLPNEPCASWLIDPAAHGGHREFDLAMMQLFGGWADDVFDAYDEATPLADGWRDRVGLHQLAPLAVHAIKFGGGYVRATAETAQRYCQRGLPSAPC